MEAPSPKRIGYWISEKKSKKLSLSNIEDALRDLNIEAVKIDLSSPLSDQGTFHGFLHKLTDVIARADQGNIEAQELLFRFEDFLRENPHVAMIDSIDTIRTMLDRFKTYTLIQNCDFETDVTVFVPPFVVLESDKPKDNVSLLRTAKVEFPLVCKPIMGHGSSSAHEMTLVFNEKGLSQCNFPCVVQSFVNHNAVLYKLFAIGEESFMVVRPSIKNLYASDDADPIHFHSDEVSKPATSNVLTLQDQDAREISQKPCPEVLKKIARGVYRKLKVGLFGVDVVLEPATGKYAIIDVNVFPGYDGVDDFPERLANYIRSELDKLDECTGNNSAASQAQNQKNCPGSPVDPYSMCEDNWSRFN